MAGHERGAITPTTLEAEATPWGLRLTVLTLLLLVLGCTSESEQVTDDGSGGTAPTTAPADADPPPDPSATPPTAAVDVGPPPCITVEPPAVDFAQVVAQSPEGTCFEFTDGIYDFHSVIPKNDMTFTGRADREQVIIDGTGHENAFHGEAANVTISTMTFRSFDDAAGTFPQPQAPIRGSTELWPPADGTGLASGWRIHNIVAHGNVASGVVVGHDFTIVDSEFYDNGVNGISGGNFDGVRIEANTIYGNGASGASGQGNNAGGIKLAANVGERPITITNNVVYGNNMAGIWCDLQCNNVTIASNTISDQPDHGILYEISANAVISDNTITDSGANTRWGEKWAGGCITVAESESVLVTGNTLQGCDGAIVLQQTFRPQSNETFLAERYADGSVTTDRLANITVTENTIIDSNGFGVGESPDGVGLVDYTTIVFDQNAIMSSTDQPAETLFWSNGVSTLAAG